jgi:carbamoyl-phosphate synthase large subunit
MKQSPLVHVLGAGPWQLPTIRRAQELGYRVLVTDMAQERPGYRLADVGAIADVSNPEETLEVGKRHGIDAIVCDTTDAGVVTAAYVAEALGLPGIGVDVARRFTDKSLMRAACKSAGVPQPAFVEASTKREMERAIVHLGLPVVVKPLDRMAGVGVRHVDNLENLEALFEHASGSSPSGRLIVETRLHGTECTVEGCVVDGEAFVLGISDKEHFEHMPTVAKRIRFPAAISDAAHACLLDVHQDVVRALGMTQGLTHAEYFVDGDDVQLVEIAARGGGSEIFTHALPAHSGVDVLGANLRFCLGDPFDIPAPQEERPAVQIEFLEFGAGKVIGISGVNEARRSEGVISLFFDIREGAEIPAIENDRHRKAHVVAVGATREEAHEHGLRAAAHLKVVLGS